MKTYLEAKRDIKREGYANVQGDALTLSRAEILADHFTLRAMGSKRTTAKKIYLWLDKHPMDSLALVKCVVSDKTDGNLWTFWNALLDNKPYPEATKLTPPCYTVNVCGSVVATNSIDSNPIT